MRQLTGQGWVHNRARMVVASFLAKHLLVDWREGARFLLQHLMDGDLPANNGGWPWVAGTGTDAGPYYRVFNPVTQAEKFDPAGDSIRRWVPELAKLEAPAIFAPWRAATADLEAAGVRLGTDYPPPIVDHAAPATGRWPGSRRRASAAEPPRLSTISPNQSQRSGRNRALDCPCQRSAVRPSWSYFGRRPV
jgi:deoxyribodipyrimidine photolyase